MPNDDLEMCITDLDFFHCHLSLPELTEVHLKLEINLHGIIYNKEKSNQEHDKLSTFFSLASFIIWNYKIHLIINAYSFGISSARSEEVDEDLDIKSRNCCTGTRKAN